jgi:SAM domain (Sterile alpha motif)
MDVARLLHGLGLERYEQAFRDNAIDAEILPDLTDVDLAALSVLLGHRKNPLKAAAVLYREPMLLAPGPGCPSGR